MVNYSDSEYEIDIPNPAVERPLFRIKYRSNSVASITDHINGEKVVLPTIKVFGTGGTIASKGSTAYQTAGYEIDLTVEDLIHSIPDLSSTCNLEYEQVMNVDSNEIGTPELLLLHRRILSEVDNYDGFVITHGTDTMEETAFFLQQSIDTEKPIILCGSMRPSTAISSDGPMNLYQAISIAANKSSRGRGVLIALNDRIGSGFHITKSNANSLDTFKSSNHGDIGHFVNNEIHYYFPPVKPLGIKYFDLTNTLDLPEVPIIYAHQGLNNKLIELSIRELGADGLVFATMGAGSLPKPTFDVIGNLIKDSQIPIVYSKRSQDGMVPKASIPNYFKLKDGNDTLFKTNIAGGYLNPQKCRILLQLCLNSKMETEEIKECFTGVYGG